MKKILLILPLILLISLTYVNAAKFTAIRDCREITEPGNYVLMNDITIDSEIWDVCLDVYANDVTIDGRGYTIYGDDNVNTIIDVSGGSNFLVKNIDLRYAVECISTYGTNNVEIKDSFFNCLETNLDLGPGDGLKVYNNKLERTDSECLFIVSTSNAKVYNNTLDCNEDGIVIQSTSNAMIYSNKISSGWNALVFGMGSRNNIVYNNYIKGYHNSLFFIEPLQNNLNTNKQFGKNIVGGPYLGGNYYTNYARTGYSDTCLDSNKDGLCDQSYSINGSTDYYPLTKYSIFFPLIGVNR